MSLDETIDRRSILAGGLAGFASFFLPLPAVASEREQRVAIPREMRELGFGYLDEHQAFEMPCLEIPEYKLDQERDGHFTSIRYNAKTNTAVLQTSAGTRVTIRLNTTVLQMPGGLRVITGPDRYTLTLEERSRDGQVRKQEGTYEPREAIRRIVKEDKKEQELRETTLPEVAYDKQTGIVTVKRGDVEYKEKVTLPDRARLDVLVDKYVKITPPAGKVFVLKDDSRYTAEHLLLRPYYHRDETVVAWVSRSIFKFGYHQSCQSGGRVHYHPQEKGITKALEDWQIERAERVYRDFRR